MSDVRPPVVPEQDTPEFHLPPDHWPLPELTTAETHPHPSGDRYLNAQDGAEFGQLRKTFRNFAFPTVTAVLVVYFIYVLLSTYAHALMITAGPAGLNVGFWLSLLMFPITWIATWAYVRHANNKLDPLAARIRTELESEEASA